MTEDEDDAGTALVTPNFTVPEEGGNWVTAEFYSVIKKVNSTYTPPAGSGHVYDVVLKNGTSLASPTLTIQGFEPKYNYFWFQNCYYYVSDVVRINSTICEISGTRDALGTHKEEIYNSTAYVEYSSVKYNKWLPDQRLSMTGKCSSSVSSQLIFDNINGSYIIIIAGKGEAGTTLGFSCAYKLSSADTRQWQSILYDESFITELKKYFADPYEAIISAHWVPFAVDVATSATVYFGGKNSGLTAGGVGSQEGEKPTVVSLSIPKINGDWRDSSPYSLYKLELPFYGTVDLDASLLQGEENLTVEYLTDPISGEVAYMVKCKNWQGQYTVGTAVQLAVGQSSGNKITAISSAIAGAGAAAAGLAAAPVTGGSSVAVAGAYVTGISAIAGGVMQSFTHDLSAKGGQGGYARANMVLGGGNDNKSIRLVQYSFDMAEGNPSGINSINGRPLFDTVKLSTVWGGYIKTAGASIPIDGLAEDRAQVNSMLNSGIFVE